MKWFTNYQEISIKISTVMILIKNSNSMAIRFSKVSLIINQNLKVTVIVLVGRFTFLLKCILGYTKFKRYEIEYFNAQHWLQKSKIRLA